MNNNDRHARSCAFSDVLRIIIVNGLICKLCGQRGNMRAGFGCPISPSRSFRGKTSPARIARIEQNNVLNQSTSKLYDSSIVYLVAEIDQAR